VAKRLVIKSKVRVGRAGEREQHNARKLVIKSKVRAGARSAGDPLGQHNGRRLVVKSAIKAGKRGGWDANHNARRV